MEQISLGTAAAIQKYETRWWEGKTAREIAVCQLQTKELICPWTIFHQSMEAALGRSVYTHEFARTVVDGLWAELTQGAAPPSLEDILGPLTEKTIIVRKGETA